jgi:hypothetical protein
MHRNPTQQARRTKVEKRPGIYYRVGADGRRHYEITFIEAATGRRRWLTIDGNLEQAQAELDDVRSNVPETT